MPLTPIEKRFESYQQYTNRNEIASAILVLAEVMETANNQTHDHRVELTIGDRGSLDLILNPPHGETFHVQTEEA